VSTTAGELTVLEPAPLTRSREWHAAARRARMLSWLSLAWMGAEGAVAITAGVLTGSIALISFGLDSAIEGFASRHRLALHRLAPALARSRGTGSEAGRDPVLPARPLRRLRGYSQAVDGGGAGDELARDRARHLERDRDALPRDRQAPARRQARLGRHPRRGHAEPALRVPRRRRPGRPPRQRALRALVVAAVAVREGRQSWRGEGCCATC
jgi:hypothetical protein